MDLKTQDIFQKGELKPISLGDIKVPDYHDRTDVDPQTIEKLANNMSQVGQINPIILEKKGEGFFELISGLRRFEAALKLNWSTINAIVLENLDEQSRILIMIAENAQRQNLNDYDLVVSLIHFLSVSVKKTDEEIKAFLYKLKNLETGNIKAITTEEKELKKTLEEYIKRTDRYTLKNLTGKIKVLNFHQNIIKAMKERKLLFTYALMLNKIKDEERMNDILSKFLNSELNKDEFKKEILNILHENKIVFPFDNFIKTLKGDFNNFTDEKKKVIQDKIAELEKILSA